MAKRIGALTLPEWALYMSKLGKEFGPAARRGLRRGALESLSIVQRRTSELNAVNLGILKRGWKVEHGVDVSLLYNTQLYASVVEYGRRAGSRMPPIQPIAEWARRRLGLSSKEARAAAFGIAASIKRRGIKGRFLMGGALNQFKDAVRRGVVAELEKALKGR